MIIPDEIISKNPRLEESVDSLEKMILKVSATNEEKNELNELADAFLNLKLAQYFLGKVQEKDREQFLDLFTKEDATYSEVMGFVDKNYDGRGEGALQKEVLEVYEESVSGLLKDFRQVDEVNIETKLPVK